jgi:hypothetical protein
MLNQCKEVEIMMIRQYLRETFSRLVDAIQAAWSRVQAQGPEMADKVASTVGRFFTSPLTDTEYALLKRVSGIMGTAAAVYIIYMAGIQNAVVIFGLCVMLALALYQVNGWALTQGQESH